MGAFHVVCVDFKLRFGIHAGRIGKKQIVICLVGLSFLRILSHDDAAVEIDPSHAAHKILEKLRRRASRHIVSKFDMHTDFLIGRGYADTVKGKPCTLAVQVNFQRNVRTDPWKSDKQDGKFLIAPKDNRLRNDVASNKICPKVCHNHSPQ